MNPGDFTQLKGINDQTDVSMSRKPLPMMLKGDLIAVSATSRMTTNIKHRGKLPFNFGRTIEVSRNIQTRHALKMQLFDSIPITLDSTRHFRIERCPFRKWPKAKHVEELTLQFRASGFPFGLGFSPFMNVLT